MGKITRPCSNGRRLAPKDFITPDSLFPQAFDSALPTAGKTECLADPAVQLLVEYFQTKGLDRLKQEDQREEWYRDWIDYQSVHGLYASLLSPSKYSSRGHRLDLRRLTQFLEVFAYFSPAHAYSLHVSFLGLFPILQSDNEPLKREAVARLEAGGLFAFAVSERGHGSDLLATEFVLRVNESGKLRATGSKSYIGNVNAAELISVLAKKSEVGEHHPARRASFVFFALRPRETQALATIRKIRTYGIRTAFVGEFEVVDHPVPTADVICEGRSAWDAVLGAVDFGKVFLGFGAVGICEHAFAESFGHLHRRVLYGKPVTELPHIRSTVTSAFARLVAMKLYACRALDYLQAAGPSDRRYLLFNAVQKSRVSTQGVKVLALLSECIGAKGFEADTYFETALREAPMIPGLEGSTHINFRLTTQFTDNYFADAEGSTTAPVSTNFNPDDPEENPYWLGRQDRHPKTVTFEKYLAAYAPLRDIPNVWSFMAQVRVFRRWIVGDARPTELAGDAALSVAVGRCFSIVVYAQLVAENCVIAGVEATTVSMIFLELIQDLTADMIKLMSLFPDGSPERTALRKTVVIPQMSTSDLVDVFQQICARYL